jgi:hypothetical protein
MWIVALKNFGSFEAWGSWQFRHSITVASMFRCALPNDARCEL